MACAAVAREAREVDVHRPGQVGIGQGVAVVVVRAVEHDAAVERVVARVTSKVIGAGAAEDRVVPIAAAQCVVAVAARQRVVAVVTEQAVVAVAAIDAVVASVAGECVVVVRAEEVFDGDERVAAIGPAARARTKVDADVAACIGVARGVAAVAAVERVVAGVALQSVVAVQAADAVVAGVAQQLVGHAAADEGVVERAAASELDRNQAVAAFAAAATGFGAEVDAHGVERVAVVDEVVAGAAVDGVVAAIAGKAVVVAVARKRVGEGRSFSGPDRDQRVGATEAVAGLARGEVDVDRAG